MNKKGLVPCTVVMALSVSLSAQGSDNEDTEVERILVNAQLRQELPQEVPISLSAMNANMLEKENIGSLQDLAGSIPSVVVSESVSYGNAPISIRGIGGPTGGGSLLTEQPVAVYVDGVYVRALGQAVSDFLDVDMLQVLRGPQGTLYGRNSTAGAILLTSKRAVDYLEGSAKIGIAQYDRTQFSGVLNIPLIEGELAARAAVSFTDGGDWAKNTVDSREFGGSDSSLARLSLRYTPTDNLTIDLIGDVSKGKNRPATLQLSTASLNTVIPGLPVQLYGGEPTARRSDYAALRDARQVQIIGEQSSETESENATLYIDWRLDNDITLTSISGYRHFHVDGIQDTTPWLTGALPGLTGSESWNSLTGTFGEGMMSESSQYSTSTSALVLGWNRSIQDTKTWSQELRLAGNSGALTWVSGLYAAKEKIDAEIQIINEQGGPPMLVIPTPGVVPGSVAGLNLNFLTNQENTVLAAFADATYDVSDKVSVTAGLRYSHDEKEAYLENSTQTLRTSVVDNLNTGTVATCTKSACTESFSQFTPRAVLRYTPQQDHMFYVSYSKGFTSGGFNNFGDISGEAEDRPLLVDSETISNIELGTKNFLFDRAVTLDLSLFHSTYENLQIRQAVNTGGVAIVNVPEAEIMGLETSSTWNATDNLKVQFNLSHLNTEITKGNLYGFPDDFGYVSLGSLQTPSAIDVSGRNLTRAPKWIGNVKTDYTWELLQGYATASMAFKFQSENAFSETNQSIPQYRGESWQVMDVSLSYESEGQNWVTSVYINNVFDDRFATQIVPFFNWPIATLNQPRTAGIKVQYSFE